MRSSVSELHGRGIAVNDAGAAVDRAAKFGQSKEEVAQSLKFRPKYSDLVRSSSIIVDDRFQEQM